VASRENRPTCLRAYPSEECVHMAGTSLLALLDDIASVLDDVATLTKVATKKTAGVLGDDLALNAEQVSGMQAERELPVVWAVAKGSAVNKAILVPVALALSQWAPWSIMPLLMFGGAYLCFEGFEKIAHKLLHDDDHDEAERKELLARASDPSVDLVALEKEKIRGAVRTDFVLSAEIVTIALGTVADMNFGTRAAVLGLIAVLMTIGVYGLVACIVKLDDLGLYLSKGNPRTPRARFGRLLLRGAPWLMKGLTIAGTVAMFLVGGGIVAHGIPVLHHLEDALGAAAGGVAYVGPLLHGLLPVMISGVVGLVTGALSVGAVTLFNKLRR
jgi:predicted DNA repair protein MutK